MRFINNCRRKHGNIDRNLIIILFVQVNLGILLTVFRCGFYFIVSVQEIKIKIFPELIFDKMSLLIYYINFSKSFFVNTLTSPSFR